MISWGVTLVLAAAGVAALLFIWKWWATQRRQDRALHRHVEAHQARTEAGAHLDQVRQQAARRARDAAEAADAALSPKPGKPQEEANDEPVAKRFNDLS